MDKGEESRIYSTAFVDWSWKVYCFMKVSIRLRPTIYELRLLNLKVTDWLR